MAESRLDGRSILILEDEYLIAMDVEQTCLEWGAREVTILRSLDDLGERPFEDWQFDAAILDLRLGGETTAQFAGQLLERRIPFVFATGLTNVGEIADGFPDVPVVGKPYSGDELARVLSEVIQRSRSGCGA
ncbi:response regulator [Aquibium carbonis]|uniref:response regulator n=1 Tax=Aquibium carbonis TaxID=2495581 RepID=UPI001FE086A6|nr:response regulator [Aquibium carbonis]